MVLRDQMNRLRLNLRKMRRASIVGESPGIREEAEVLFRLSEAAA
jgi:hypothetical protein